MKSQSFLRTIFSGILMILLGACANVSPDGHPWITGISGARNSLVGTWTNSLGTVWTIKPEGTFSVLVHGKKHVWGNYTLAGNTITIVGVGGAVPKGCKGPGVYKFSRPNANTLTFTLVSDACRMRKHDVPLPWHLK